MKFGILFTVVLCTVGSALAGVIVDESKLGDSLGGWTKRSEKAAEYALSGANYRTYRPEVTPTPEGGIFISLRIDHVRGWLSSDDHAILEITVGQTGRIVSAQSSIAIQGRSVTSDLIRGGTTAGQTVVGVDRAVEIGTTLIADISAKMLREKIVEAGRVSFPSALRHNYNLLYQAISVEEEIPKAIAANPLDPAFNQDTKQESPQPKVKNQGLEIRPYGESSKLELSKEEER